MSCRGDLTIGSLLRSYLGPLMFIHAKFNDPDGHRTVDMAEKPKFEFMWGTCLFMPSLMILIVIEQWIWLKNPNLGFFGCFLSISYGKTVIRIEACIHNSA